MKKFKRGYTYNINGVNYVLMKIKTVEAWNMGGYVDYYYTFVKKTSLLRNHGELIPHPEDIVELKDDGYFLLNRKTDSKIVEIDEAPFEVESEEVTLYTYREKV